MSRILNRQLFWLSTVAAAALLGGCANLAPGYVTPTAPVPASWAAGATAANTVSANTGWQDVVTDANLRQTITLALANNRDLRGTLLAIAQARASYQIQQAAQLPTVNASAGASASRTPAQASSSGAVVNTRTLTAGVGVAAYELDFFGRVQNLKDAALQAYLQTEEAARSAQIALVAEVSTAWLTLAADQDLQALAQATLKSQQDSYAMTQKRVQLGADSELTLVQAQTTVQAAQRDAAAYASQVQQDRNALDLLVGGTLPEGLLPQAGAAQLATQLVAVPAELPSAVLQRRPDVLAAEHQLKAANADIGAARAALFPSISLTAQAGTASRSLGSLFQGGAWSFAPSISLPIFDGGARKAAVDSAEVTRDIRLASYDKTVQTAFREVADALAVRATLGARLDAQQALVQATQRSLQLAQARNRSGADSYLTVLDAQRSHYAAQQALINLQLAEQSNRVTLFKVLGGGWPQG
jgi:NodT family efflux transporter outer membrane factor (OMF) lipoprotein